MLDLSKTLDTVYSVLENLFSATGNEPQHTGMKAEEAKNIIRTNLHDNFVGTDPAEILKQAEICDQSFATYDIPYGPLADDYVECLDNHIQLKNMHLLDRIASMSVDAILDMETKRSSGAPISAANMESISLYANELSVSIFSKVLSPQSNYTYEYYFGSITDEYYFGSISEDEIIETAVYGMLADVRGKYPDFQRCPEGVRGHLYRAIEQEVNDSWSLDLVPIELMGGTSVKNPRYGDIPYFRIYGDAAGCTYPDALNPGEDAFYTILPKPLSRGGRNQPYPDSVPKCTVGQTLARIISKPDRETDTHAPTWSHAMSFMAPGWKEIEDDEVEELLKHHDDPSGVGMICQKRISNSPERYGLFWFLNYDPLGELEAKPLRGGLEGLLMAEKHIRKILPEAMERCQPTADEIKTMYGMSESAAKILDEHIKAGWDPILKEKVAPAVVDEIVKMHDIGRMKLSQKKILEDIVSFGIQHGVDEEDILGMATDLTERDTGLETLVYGIATIVSLRVAKSFNTSPLGEGLISGDLEPFVDAVEAAIRNGRISIRTKSERDVPMSNLVYAYYNSDDNEITFPPLNGNFNTTAIFGTIVHECYHAYQDMNHDNRPLVEIERAAHERDIKATNLLLNAGAIMSESDILTLSDYQQTGTAYALAVQANTLRCMGVPEKVVEKTKTTYSDANNFYMDYQGEVMLEMLGLQDGTSINSFYSFFSLQNYLTVEKNIMDASMIKHGKHYETMKTMGISKEEMADAREDIEYARVDMDDGYFEPTYAGSVEASKYLNLSSDLAAYTYYWDRDTWGKIMEERAEMFDSIAEVLMYAYPQLGGIE
ncbi:MAG: hypothetical protein WC683_05500 [bacterium]